MAADSIFGHTCAVSERWSRLWLVHGTLRARLALLPGISFRVSSVFENKNSLSVKDRFTCQGSRVTLTVVLEDSRASKADEAYPAPQYTLLLLFCP